MTKREELNKELQETLRKAIKLSNSLLEETQSIANSDLWQDITVGNIKTAQGHIQAAINYFNN